MRRTVGRVSLLLALLLCAAGVAIATFPIDVPYDVGDGVLSRAVLAMAVLVGAYGLYLLVARAIDATATSKRQSHDALMVLRFAIGVAAAVSVLALVTERRLGLMVSLGVIGFGITFALQQPLFSLIGWTYLVVERPYRVGDRVRIEDAKGDVVDVDFLVTTLWEIGGELVSGNSPRDESSRSPTARCSPRRSSDEFPYVWNELSMQVAYETDLEFARQTTVEEVDDFLGDEIVSRNR